MKTIQKKLSIILIVLSIFLCFILIPDIVLGQSYQLLQPDVAGGMTQVESTDDFIQYLANIFTTILVLTVVLTVVVFTWGALEYVASGIPGVKNQGKDRMMYAVGGLVLALGSWLILNTINPNLTLIKLDFSTFERRVNTAEQITSPNENNSVPGVNQPSTGGAGDLYSGHSNFSTNNSLLENAREAQDLSTRNAPSTNMGAAACAYAVNEIVAGTYGQPINNSPHTSNMFRDLQTDNRFQQIQGGVAAAQPGDIIISPSPPGGSGGHVGICNSPGCAQILSNSSSSRTFRQNFTDRSWNDSYSHLGTFIFRPI